MADEKKIVVELKEGTPKERPEAPPPRETGAQRAAREAGRAGSLGKGDQGVPVAKRLLTEEFKAIETESGEVKWVSEGMARATAEKMKKPPKPPKAPYYDPETQQWLPTKPPPIIPKPPQNATEKLLEALGVDWRSLKEFWSQLRPPSQGVGPAGGPAGGGPGVPPIPPVPIPPGGAGGQVPPGVPPGAGAAGAAGGAAGAAAAAIGLKVALTGAAVAVVGITTAMTTASAAANSLMEELKQFSVLLAQANAEEKIRMIQARLKAAREVGPELASLRSELTDIKIRWFELKSILVEKMYSSMVMVLDLLEAILVLIKWVITAWSVMFKTITSLVYIIPGISQIAWLMKWFQDQKKKDKAKEKKGVHEIREFFNSDEVEKLTHDEEFSIHGFPPINPRGKM